MDGGLATSNPLARGFYTVVEAARLIENGRAPRIYGWLRGYPKRDIGPLLTRDYRPINDREELSFLDLIEVRFVEHFRHHNVKMRTLRRAAEKLRSEFDTPHPFASDRVHLVADPADVFLIIMRDAAKETRDRALLSLTTDNYVFEEIIKRHLVPGISFDRRDHLARRWIPRPTEFPEIVVDPHIAFGQPVGPSHIPTTTLFSSWQAEDEDEDAVAFWFEIKAAEVRRAVDFEKHLDSRLIVAA
jgi:uncharacterized protein (DUF433 family)